MEYSHFLLDMINDPHRSQMAQEDCAAELFGLYLDRTAIAWHLHQQVKQAYEQFNISVLLPSACKILVRCFHHMHTVNILLMCKINAGSFELKSHVVTVELGSGFAHVLKLCLWTQ